MAKFVLLPPGSRVSTPQTMPARPVSGSMQTGVSASADGSLQFLTSSMSCRIAGVGARALFAGLAPGIIGAYQVNLQILSTRLRCDVTSGGTREGGLFAPCPAQD